jgi:hypothetical protein
MSGIKFKSCDRVYSKSFGPGIVTSTSKPGYTYPVYVEFTRFDGRKYIKSFTSDGRHYVGGPASLRMVEQGSES